MVENYETYEFNPNINGYSPVLRYRGSGKPHGEVKPPFILEPKPGSGPGAGLKLARPAFRFEIPGIGGGLRGIPPMSMGGGSPHVVEEHGFPLVPEE